jgi:bifunctional DNA-binding transcriptional regulator/antitoxin component of YhaV-PrlF toxin-antitoxin module
MAVAVTLRDKNQVTLPANLLVRHGFRKGDALVFSDLPDGGIVVRRAEADGPGVNAYQVFKEIADSIRGLERIDWEPPERAAAPMRAAEL